MSKTHGFHPCQFKMQDLCMDALLWNCPSLTLGAMQLTYITKPRLNLNELLWEVLRMCGKLRSRRMETYRLLPLGNLQPYQVFKMGEHSAIMRRYIPVYITIPAASFHHANRSVTPTSIIHVKMSISLPRRLPCFLLQRHFVSSPRALH